MGEVKVELSLSDAEELFRSLEKMFGNKTTYYPYYVQPYTYPYRWWYNSPTYTLCADNGNSWKLPENTTVKGTTLNCNIGNLFSAKLTA